MWNRMSIQSHKKFEMHGFNSHSMENFGLCTFPFINISVCDNLGKSTFPLGIIVDF